MIKRRLFNQAKICLNSNKSIKYFKSSLNQTIFNKFIVYDDKKIFSLYNRINFSFSQQKSTKLKQQIENYLTTHQKQSSQVIYLQNDLARQYLSQKHISQAIQTYEDILGSLKKIQKKQDIIITLKILSKLYRYIQDHIKIQQTTKQLIFILQRQQASIQTLNSLAFELTSLAISQFQLEKHTQSLESLSKAQKIYQSQSTQSQQYINVQHQIALNYQSLKRFQECQQIMIRNIPKIRKIPNVKIERVLLSMIVLLRAYNGMANRQLIRKCLNEIKQDLQTVKQDQKYTNGFAQIYQQMANVYYQLLQCQQSLLYSNLSFQINSKTSSPNPMIFLQSYFYNGACYQQLLQFDKAIQAYEKVVNLFESNRQLYNTSALTLVQALMNIGSIHFNMSKLHQSQQSYLKAKNLLQNIDNKDYRLGYVYHILATIQMNIGDQIGAQQHLRKSLQIYSYHKDTNSSLYGQLLITYSKYHARYTKNYQLLELALRYFQSYQPLNQNHYDIYQIKGDCYYSTKQYQKAIESYYKCMQVFHSVVQFRKDQFNQVYKELKVAFIKFRIGQVYCESGDLQQAEINLNQAIKTFDHYQQVTDPAEAIDLYSLYGILQIRLDNHTKARLYLLKADQIMGRIVQNIQSNKAILEHQQQIRKLVESLKQSQ